MPCPPWATTEHGHLVRRRQRRIRTRTQSDSGRHYDMILSSGGVELEQQVSQYSRFSLTENTWSVTGSKGVARRFQVRRPFISLDLVQIVDLASFGDILQCLYRHFAWFLQHKYLRKSTYEKKTNIANLFSCKLSNISAQWPANASGVCHEEW